MYTAVVTIHIIVCIILVLTVLLQQGKGAEVGAVFGSSETMFGSTGPASALNKLTTVVAIIFMLTSLGLTYLAAHRKGDSVMENVKIQATVPSLPASQQAESAGSEAPPAGSPDSDVQEQTSQAVAIPAEAVAPSAEHHESSTDSAPEGGKAAENDGKSASDADGK